MDIDLPARGAQLLANPTFAPYLREHFIRSGADPDNYVALCIAENRSMWDVLVPRLAHYRDIPPRVLGYDAMIGNLEFRTQLAAFMARTFLGRSFAPEQLAVVAGAGAVLELLFHALADAGEGVLIPTPSYAGFWADLETREVLLAKLAGAMKANLSKAAATFQAPLVQAARLAAALQEKRSSES